MTYLVNLKAFSNFVLQDIVDGGISPSIFDVPVEYHSQVIEQAQSLLNERNA